MKEFIGECRYGQFGCDFIIVRYCGNNPAMVQLLSKACDNLSSGDDEAMEAAGVLCLAEGFHGVEILKLQKYED